MPTSRSRHCFLAVCQGARAFDRNSVTKTSQLASSRYGRRCTKPKKSAPNSIISSVQEYNAYRRMCRTPSFRLLVPMTRIRQTFSFSLADANASKLHELAGQLQLRQAATDLALDQLNGKLDVIKWIIEDSGQTVDCHCCETWATAMFKFETWPEPIKAYLRSIKDVQTGLGLDDWKAGLELQESMGQSRLASKTRI